MCDSLDSLTRSKGDAGWGRKEKKAFDFFVEWNGIEDTLEKLMEWALQEEKYEMCSEIKELQSNVKSLDF